MKKNSKSTDAALRRAAQMPPLTHGCSGEDFDMMKSEAALWLSEQPELRQKLFDWCMNGGAIVFRNGLWQGVKYGEQT
jgi:hypothetical protein